MKLRRNLLTFFTVSKFTLLSFNYSFALFSLTKSVCRLFFSTINNLHISNTSSSAAPQMLAKRKPIQVVTHQPIKCYFLSFHMHNSLKNRQQKQETKYSQYMHTHYNFIDTTIPTTVNTI